jgi:hypothetical protein
MKSAELSRRSLVGAIGAGAAIAAAGIASRASASVAANASGAALPASSEPVEMRADWLVAPLVAGSSLGAWEVVEVLPLTDGALSVVMRDARGERFQLDVCARDDSPGAPRSPGASERLQIFVANVGDGARATFEDHGLAAMALAEIVRANEAGRDLTGFGTLGARATSARLHVR